ncbi:uncharacterized protein EV420DRAFT_1565178 [Desarmillaria tabescens]|uniref:DUF6534 domain-containing protein n=1 Tax=Armillaria tabescens TaxID=1929756 RepID=A0AA39JVM3_ARMTA|nr:uncharacterized protein EV420DRAFT_1565178 [Desarmillaria tabescens]KAK0449639.1 hypothetical protein EV420DRAFT_1565178 [Desarmillaria tabescens]
MQPIEVPVQSNQIVGSLEIGVFFNLILMGAALVQGTTYFRRCGRDLWVFKLLVTLCFDSGSRALAMLRFYRYTTLLVIIADVADPRKPRSSYFLASVAIVEPLSTASSPGFVLFPRLPSLRQQIQLAVVMSLLVAFRLSVGIFLGYRAVRDVPMEPAFMVFQRRWDWLLTSGFAVGALADLMIACTLCYHVNQLASPLVMETSGGVLNGIFLRSLQTGLITSLASVTVLICFQTMQDTFAWIGVYIVLGKLYSNALLSSLNARHSYRRMMNMTHLDDDSDTSVNSKETTRRGKWRSRRFTHPGVIEL